MALYIGVLNATNEVLNPDVPYSNRSISPKIYSVSFSMLGTDATTTRGHTSSNYDFSFSTSEIKGKDDFIANNAGPFMIRECCTRYNSSTNEQEVVSYKGDNTWNSDILNPNYEVMIEFPVFYYARVNPYQIMLSDQLVHGFIPSEMHYRNGKLYQYAYISKFMLNKEGKSVYNTLPSYVDHLKPIRDVVKNKGMYLLDLKAQCMLAMLMLVKYGDLYFNYTARPLGSNSFVNHKTGMSRYIRSEDGALETGTASITVNLGLEDFLCWPGIWLDGSCVWNQYVYVYNDIESFDYDITFDTYANGRTIITNDDNFIQASYNYTNFTANAGIISTYVYKNSRTGDERVIGAAQYFIYSPLDITSRDSNADNNTKQLSVGGCYKALGRICMAGRHINDKIELPAHPLSYHFINNSNFSSSNPYSSACGSLGIRSMFFKNRIN